MAYAAKILLDSVSENGDRLTTMELTYPRFIHAEVMTHRVCSRNSASSRAIPIQKMMEQVKNDPVIPIFWGKNQKGMKAEEELSADQRVIAVDEWLKARDQALQQAEKLLALKVHKQITNRILEPFLWMTIILTSTEWKNFFSLRCHQDAQPEIKKIAEMMQEIYDSSQPKLLKRDEWHLPLVFPEDREQLSSQELIKISAGRCCRVSYLTHSGKRDLQADLDLCGQLIQDFHMSPLEHQATPYYSGNSYGVQATYENFINNFRGWIQYRRLIQGS